MPQLVDLPYISLDDIGDPEMYDSRKIHYPTTEPNEIPTVEKYVEFNVTYVSPPESSDDDSKIISADIEIKLEEEEEQDNYDSDIDCGDCFGFKLGYSYGSNYDEGYDSY